MTKRSPTDSAVLPIARAMQEATVCTSVVV